MRVVVLLLVLAGCADADQQMSSGRAHAVCIGICVTATMTRQHEIVRHKDGDTDVRR